MGVGFDCCCGVMLDCLSALFIIILLVYFYYAHQLSLSNIYIYNIYKYKISIKTVQIYKMGYYHTVESFHIPNM